MLALALTSLLFAAPLAGEIGPANLPKREPQSVRQGESFDLASDREKVHIWGRGREPARVYFDEFLPALFERTLILDNLDLEGGALEWIFTGERGGFTVRVEDSAVRVLQRFYDSFGLNELKGGNVRASRHPEKRWVESAETRKGRLRALTVKLDHRLGLSVAVNGREVLRQVCLFDVSRHQLRLAKDKGKARGRLVKPEQRLAVVRIYPERKHQKILGFGGIATPMAYARLSQEGKRRWWEIVCEYNLLIQREYPIGTRLDGDMRNWDRLEDATPHYYGDNFPNGEISDFSYLKTLRRLGGRVLFEFWELPSWAKRDWKDSKGKLHHGVADPGLFARAVVRYCQASQEKSGAPPDIVGIQNEKAQPPDVWHKMALTLRQELDRAGFKSVRIHMSDAGSLAEGVHRAQAFLRSEAAWDAIDYAAAHMYDYQNSFTNPDGYDALLLKWKKLVAGKPFLSTELCVNSSRYQWPTYRLAFVMGELYHKNFAIADASAVLYCWVLLNVVQPSYGWTRSLFVPDNSHGFVPAPSSYQLRVYGAYSRRIREGMVRLGTESSARDLLASAFAGQGGAITIVLLNRSTSPQRVCVEGAGVAFREMEVVDPYRENEVRPAPAPRSDGVTEALVGPGAILTMSTVPLGKIPEGFDAAR